MKVSLATQSLSLIFLLSLTIFVYSASDEVTHINSCEKEQYKRLLHISGLFFKLQRSCSNEYLELSVKSGSSFKLLSKFLYPYSFVLKPIKETKGEGIHAAVIQLAPFEPGPTGSYYFAVIDLYSMMLIVDGYSDSEINVYDIDKDGLKEVVYGSNLSGIRPLDILLDFVPYPKVLDWNCYGGLRLVGSHAYPQLMNTYRKALSKYIKQLSDKFEDEFEDGLGSMKVALGAELTFMRSVMTSITSENNNPNAGLVVNNSKCGVLVE